MTTQPHDLLPSFGFRAEGMAESDNHEAWRLAVATMFDIDRRGRADLGPFRAEFTAYAMGVALFGRAKATAQRFTRDAGTIARSGVDHIIVQLYQEGGYEGMAGSRPIKVEPGDICVLDFAETVETTATAFACLTLVLPRAMIEPMLAAPNLLHGLVIKAGTPIATVLRSHLETLFAVAPRMTFDECEGVMGGTVALLVACLRGAIDSLDDAGREGGALTLLAIRRHIDRNLADPNLSVERVRRHFGLSRASLYRLMEPLGGVADYMRRKRLHHAFFDIIGPGHRDRRIGETARRWCFSSEASFSRAFKAAYGITPSAAREASMLGALDAGATDGRTEPGEPELTRWMRRIAAAPER